MRTGWTDLLQRHGSQFLDWLSLNGTLQKDLHALARGLRTILISRIATSDDARDVWDATPAVLSRCNDPATYEMPGAPSAYAWLHLLDRYVRTWRALEELVRAHCLPLARHGVRVLDVGTGPGPSAFAAYDFYCAMTRFSREREMPAFDQPPTITCVEFDPSTNSFRHHLAEVIFSQTGHSDHGVLAMCHSLSDFREIVPSEERARLRRQLLWEADEYFDEARNEWDSDLRYSAEEANELAQSLHRYHLIILSNFLTTVPDTRSFERNLIDVLGDAQPGSVILVMGGKGEPYPAIYEYVDGLAAAAGFRLVVADRAVSAAGTEVAHAIFVEGAAFHDHLQRLAPDTSEATRPVRSRFVEYRQTGPSSHVRAYRKYRFPRVN